MTLSKGMIVKVRKLTRDQWSNLGEECSLTRDDVAELFGSRYTGTAKVTGIMYLNGTTHPTPQDHITVTSNNCRYWLPRWSLVAHTEKAEKPSAWAARWTQMMEA